MKNKLWDNSLPDPKPSNDSGLSIISGNKDPIISENLLISNFLITGISEINNGKAIWNIRKILVTSYSN